MKVKVRFTAFFVILSMLCTTVTVLADETSYGVSELVREVVVSLGIMSNDEIDSAGYVTRAYAAKTVVAMSGNEYSAEARGNMFVDVPDNCLYAAEIEIAASNSLVFGIGGGKYGPNEAITDSDMAAILLRYAGYERVGASYSVRSELFKGVNMSDVLTYKDLANMVYNTLRLNVVSVSGISNGKAEYSVDSNKTVMNNAFDVYEMTGIIEQNGLTGLYTNTEIREDEISVSASNGKFVFKIGETDIAKMIGRKATVYYKDDKDAPYVISYVASEQMNNITKISVTNINFGTVAANQFEYMAEDNKEKKIKSNSRTAVIYNGAYYYGNFSMTLLTAMEGTVTAIDNNMDRITDVFVIDAYIPAVIKSVFLNDKFVLDMNNNKIDLDPEHYHHFELKNADGSNGNIEELEMDQVISVAISNSGEKNIIKVIVSNDTVSGSVSGLSYDQYGNPLITLGAEEDYRIMNSITNSPSVGQDVKLLLTAFSNVADVIFGGSGNTPFAVVAGYKYERREDALKITMILGDNRRVEYNVKNPIRIDGVKAKNPFEAYSLLETAANDSDTQIDLGSAGSDHPKVKRGVFPVLYKLRENGELMSIDTPYQSAEENIETLHPAEYGHYYKRNNIIGNVVAVKSSTPALDILSELSDGEVSIDSIKDSMYTSMKTISGISDSTYFMATYKIGDTSKLYADFAVFFNAWGAKSSGSSFMIFDKQCTVWDKQQDSMTYEISGYSQGNYVTYTIADLYKSNYEGMTFNKGDIIQTAEDSNGRVTHIREITKVNIATAPTDGSIVINNISEGETDTAHIKEYGDSRYIFYGYVLEREGDVIKIKLLPLNTTVNGADKSSINGMAGEELLLRIPSDVALTVYDIKHDELYIGSYDEIYPKDKFGTACSLIAFRYASNTIKDGVVYNYDTLQK